MSEAKIIDGNAVSAEVRAAIAVQIASLRGKGAPIPGLAVVLVGADPASQVYVRNKNKRAAEVGIASFEHYLPAETSEIELLSLVENLNLDPNVHGILVQLPLPKQIDAQKILESINPAKDVDGFHPFNVGHLVTGGAALVPCTPLGCLLLAKRELGDLSGKRAIVLGRSNIVGKPMAQLLLRESATVTIAHSRTQDLPEECRRADIVVAALLAGWAVGTAAGTAMAIATHLTSTYPLVIGGYTLVMAKDIDEAVEASKGCPIFLANGAVEVRPILQMNM